VPTRYAKRTAPQHLAHARALVAWLVQRGVELADARAEDLRTYQPLEPSLAECDHRATLQQLSSDRPVTAYGLDRNLDIRESTPVSLEKAIEIIDARFARLRSSYDSGEEALSETTFGFSRAEDEFMELFIHELTRVSCSVRAYLSASSRQQGQATCPLFRRAPAKRAQLNQ
jgi:hypothetical protein